MSDVPRVRLGELLVKAGLLTQEQLREALSAQQRDGRRLGTLLVEQGLVSETQVTQILSQQLSVPWVSLQHIDFSPQLLSLVPHGVVEQFCLVPIYVRRLRGFGDALYVAMDDPTNDIALSEVARHSGLHVRAMIAPPSDIRFAIRTFYGIGVSEPEPEPEPSAEREQPGDRDTPVTPLEEDGRPPQRSGVDLRLPELGAAAAGDTTHADASAVSQPCPESDVRASPAPKRRSGMGRGARMLSLTLLDGTTINVPAAGAPRVAVRGRSPDATTEDDGAPRQLTTQEIVSALRAAASRDGRASGDAAEGESPRWEALFAALLSLLLKKEIIRDFEFIDEYRNG